MEGKVLLLSIILFKKSAGAVILFLTNFQKTHFQYYIWVKKKKTLKGATNLCIGPKTREQLHGVVTM